MKALQTRQYGASNFFLIVFPDVESEIMSQTETHRTMGNMLAPLFSERPKVSGNRTFF